LKKENAINNKTEIMKGGMKEEKLKSRIKVVGIATGYELDD
jgi:hypothetical protein